MHGYSYIVLTVKVCKSTMVTYEIVVAKQEMTNQEASLPVAFRHRSSLHILTNLLDTLQITTKFTDFTVGLMQSLRSSIFWLWWHMYAWLFLHCAYGEGMQVHYGHIWNCCCKTRNDKSRSVASGSLPASFKSAHPYKPYGHLTNIS